MRLMLPICCATQKHIYRIAIQRTAGSACLEGAKYIHDHKTLPQMHGENKGVSVLQTLGCRTP